MSELEQFFCPNEYRKDYGVRCQGNVAFCGKYGKDKSRDLLYCRTCGKRFASTHDSALFGLHLPADTIRQISTTQPRELAYEPPHACWSWTNTRSTG